MAPQGLSLRAQARQDERGASITAIAIDVPMSLAAIRRGGFVEVAKLRHATGPQLVDGAES